MERGRYLHLDKEVEGETTKTVQEDTAQGESPEPPEYYQEWVEDFNHQIETYQPNIIRPPRTVVNQS
jgi:hypothetical protein